MGGRKEREGKVFQPPPHPVTTHLGHAHNRYKYLQHPTIHRYISFLVNGPQIFSFPFIPSLSHRMERIILSLTNKLLLVSIATPYIPPSVSPLLIYTPTILTALYSPGNVSHDGSHIIRKYVSIHVFVLCIRYFSACVTVHPSHSFHPQCSASHNVQFVLPNRADESIR